MSLTRREYAKGLVGPCLVAHRRCHPAGVNRVNPRPVAALSVGTCRFPNRRDAVDRGGLECGIAAPFERGKYAIMRNGVTVSLVVHSAHLTEIA